MMSFPLMDFYWSGFWEGLGKMVLAQDLSGNRKQRVAQLDC